MKTLKFRASCLALITIGLLLASCTDDPNLSLPEDLHANEGVIAATAEFDAQSAGQSIVRGWSVKVFETETELLLREQSPSATTSSKPPAVAFKKPIERKAFFGDLHVHTTYSFDGYAFGTLATPYDAYRFARGEAIANPEVSTCSSQDRWTSTPLPIMQCFWVWLKPLPIPARNFQKMNSQRPIMGSMHLKIWARACLAY